MIFSKMKYHFIVIIRYAIYDLSIDDPYIYISKDGGISRGMIKDRIGKNNVYCRTYIHMDTQLRR